MIGDLSVSLLVRLWVEIFPIHNPLWELYVSLLVRLWVEMFGYVLAGSFSDCQPPCEAVSWNVAIVQKSHTSVVVSLLVRLWVEMLSTWIARSPDSVSLLVRLWVEMNRDIDAALSGSSASLWGCELKWIFCIEKAPRRVVSLLVRLWVEMLTLDEVH